MPGAGAGLVGRPIVRAGAPAGDLAGDGRVTVVARGAALTAVIGPAAEALGKPGTGDVEGASAAVVAAAVGDTGATEWSPLPPRDTATATIPAARASKTAPLASPRQLRARRPDAGDSDLRIKGSVSVARSKPVSRSSVLRSSSTRAGAATSSAALSSALRASISAEKNRCIMAVTDPASAFGQLVA